MLNFKITIWELDSKKQERIIACENFINTYQAKIKPYKINDKKSYYEIS